MDLDPGTAWRTHPDARHAAGFQTMKPLAQCDDDNYGAQYLHLRYGRSSAIPLASRNSLPPHVQSSVQARWLAFGLVGLSNWFTSAFLGALIIFSSLVIAGFAYDRQQVVLHNLQRVFPTGELFGDVARQHVDHLLRDPKHRRSRQ